MKKPARKESILKGLQMTSVQSSEKQVVKTLRSIHSSMTTLFHVDLPFFSSVKIIKRQTFLAQLTQRVQDDLKESNMPQSGVQLAQISEALPHGRAAGLSEHFAFYNPRNDTLFVNEAMIPRYPEKALSVYAHEIAEKLLSPYVSPSKQSSTSSAIKLCLEVTKTHDATKLRELLDVYVDTVFMTVFKEGCCEAIAMQTLRSMHCSMEAESLEKELLFGYPKCVSLLSRVEEARKNWTRIGTVPSRSPSMIGQRLKDFLRLSQIIKGASYYLGYPLAKAVLEKHGLEGMLFAIENNPPLKAQYFANPQSYLVKLEKSSVPNKHGGEEK
jgi:hypothetical protein